MLFLILLRLGEQLWLKSFERMCVLYFSFGNIPFSLYHKEHHLLKNQDVV